MSNEERMKMLQDIRDHLFWTGADADEENQGEYQSWVNLLDRQIDFYKSDYYLYEEKEHYGDMNEKGLDQIVGQMRFDSLYDLILENSYPEDRESFFNAVDTLRDLGVKALENLGYRVLDE
tara:strand:- start:216 stop:578 length:363 start_codon:yes stop_codon:yes gene_type:complete